VDDNEATNGIRLDVDVDQSHLHGLGG